MATRWRETAGGQSCWPSACLQRETQGLKQRGRWVKAEGEDAIKEGMESKGLRPTNGEEKRKRDATRYYVHS